MPTTNGHGPRRAILDARVSTDEQAKKGFSILDQFRALREYAAREHYDVIEEVEDDGYSGGDRYRLGLQRVMELTEGGAADIVLAAKRDRFFRSRLHRLLWDQVLKDLGVRLVALNDTGNCLADGFQDDFAEWEKEQIAIRTMAGKCQKTREGKIVAGRKPKYGFFLHSGQRQPPRGREADGRRAAYLRDGGTGGENHKRHPARPEPGRRPYGERSARLVGSSGARAPSRRCLQSPTLIRRSES